MKALPPLLGSLLLERRVSIVLQFLFCLFAFRTAPRRCAYRHVPDRHTAAALGSRVEPPPSKDAIVVSA